LFFVQFKSVSPQIHAANICSTTVVERKNDTCPSPSSFNIMLEYGKAEGEWKIDFNVCLYYL